MTQRLLGYVSYVHARSPYISVRVPTHDCDVPLSMKARKTGLEVEGDVVEIEDTTGGYKGWKVIRFYRPMEKETQTMANSSQKFWMVWCEGTKQTSVKHPTYSEAVQEAERLARENPRNVFYVLQAESRTDCIKVQTKPLY